MNNSSPNIMREVIFIGETADEEAVILLNEDFFQNKDEKETKSLIKSLLILAQARLLENYDNINDSQKINISIDASHEELVTIIKILLGEPISIEENIPFDSLIYFGGQANPEVPLKQGLRHGAKIIETLRATLV